MSELHVVFGTGPLGLAVMRELRRRGKLVRMINRSSRVGF
jgi:NADPH-dependent 2,4-dienoyl-CoA reductase/sulfur reductase-like enzyme